MAEPIIEQRAVVVGQAYRRHPYLTLADEISAVLADLPWGPINLPRLKLVLEESYKELAPNPNSKPGAMCMTCGYTSTHHITCKAVEPVEA